MFIKDYYTKTNQIRKESYEKFTKEKYFLLCESCYWCASYYKGNTSFPKCPFCNDSKIECMPIGDEERYNFNQSPTRGVELIFSNNFRYLVQM